MAHETRTCDFCGEQVAGGNLARHKRRRHGHAPSSQPSPTPLEHCERIGDVLLACGLDSKQLGDWNIDELNKLPNIRRYRPTPRRHHTHWRVVADEELNVLPSLEDLLVDIAYRARRNGGMFAGTEVWRENDHIQFTPTEWVTWTKRILEGEQVQTRVLNMPMGLMIAADRRLEYRRRAAEVITRHISHLEAHGFRQNQASANVTPRGTRTEMHHDSEPHISTVFGLASRKSRPMKLWLLWPSTELRHLATCYGDTKAAVTRMDHGSFLVQMAGESVVVPPNSPHAVVALEPCYLYGHVFSTDSLAFEPSSVLVDIRTGDSDDKACWERVNQLRLGLRSGEFRQVYIDQFIETWAIEAPVVHGQRDQFEHMVALWEEDTRDTGSCAWCVAAGGSERYGIETDSLEHARAHLESRTPATGRG